MALFPPLQQQAPDKPDTTDRIVRKDIRSANWDGGGSLEGGKDTAATAGYLIDFDTGAMQAQAIYAEGGSLGDLTVDDELTVEDHITLSTGGIFRTAASGQRIEVRNSSRNILFFFSGDVDEYNPGSITESTSGSGTTRTLQFNLYTPVIDVDDRLAVIGVRSASPDGTSSAPGVVIAEPSGFGAGSGMAPEVRIQNSIPLITDGEVDASSGAMVLPVKTTTGDPSSPAEGQVYVNTFDNKVRVYADSAWRDLVTW
jgi:hypothetical protein